jgi:hypothetical protein
MACSKEKMQGKTLGKFREKTENRSQRHASENKKGNPSPKQKI